VHQTNIAFLHADFSEEYMDFIYSSHPPQQLPYLTVYRSREYDLGVPDERLMAAETLVALVNLFTDQEFGVE
jgi:hypothetical protein